MGKRVAFASLIIALALGWGVLPASAAKVPLKVTSTEGDATSINLAKQAIADYQKLHPDVEIAFENIPTDQITRRALAAAAAGDTLGVQLTWSHLAYETVIKNLMEPVDDVINAIGRDDFFPATLLTWQERNYLIPYFRTGNVLYVRTDLFKEKGLRPPRTWDDLLKAAQALTEKGPDGKIKRYGIVFPASRHQGTQSFVFPFIWMKGGSVMGRDGRTVTWNSPAVIETLKWWKELAKYAPPGIGQYGWNEQMQLYYSDAVAMSLYGGRLLARVQEFNPKLLEVTEGIPLPTPTGDPKEFTSLAETAGVAIMKGNANLGVAKDFAKFFMTGDRYLAWTGTVPTHFIPTKKSTFKDERYWKEPLRAKMRPTLENIIGAASVGRHLLYEWEGKVNVKANVVGQAFLAAECIQEIIIQNVPVEQAVAKYAAKMQALADSYR
jgi:ABC-type glycerol-3-phosphate transport system substrate-binding protein